MGEWDRWIGRELRQSDMLDPALARRWCATFDLEAPDDGVMPQGIHFCLCTPEAAQAALGKDGHPLRDDNPASFFTPIPLRRRLGAASDNQFMATFTAGGRIAPVTGQTSPGQ